MIVFYTNNISPHQLPLAHEVAKRVGYENFVYVGDEIAWRGKVMDAGGISTQRRRDAEDILETCEVLYVGGIRPIDLMERRAKKGLKTFYASERWFKPILVGSGKWVVGSLPGWVRMLVPEYRRMAKRFVKLVNENECVKFLPIGPHAWADFVKMGVKEEKMALWGYYVAPSSEPRAISDKCKVISDGILKVLWVGRDLAWKRAKDIERAVAIANKNLAQKLNYPPLNTQHSNFITFTKLMGVTLEEVRKAMQEHDVYVLASNAEEGWGAALNEALEEGMNAIGTFEAGASAAMLPKERLYHAGDVCALAKLLEAGYRGELPPCSIGDWTAAKAAERLCNLS